MKRIILSAIVLVSLLVVNTSCSKAKDAAKKTMEVAKDAANKTADVAKDAAHKTTEVVKDGANAVKDGANAVTDAAKKALTGNATKGKEVFTAKGCVACHNVSKKVVGPTLQTIAKVYAEKNGNMVKFLKGNADAIVDTDPAQVAVMKANITGILKGMSAEDLQAITAYIRSTK